MKIPVYQVDAFASALFTGNPAAVCPLAEWLPTGLMQNIAQENNLSETVFFVPAANGYHIRWFTPEFEIDLCGHATLAASWVIFNRLGHASDTIIFESQSGELVVKKKGEWIELNFPSRMPLPAEAPAALLEGMNIPPAEVWLSRDYFLVMQNQAEVLALQPNMQAWNRISGAVGVIVTAPGIDCDFVSRFFVPNSVIFEDPVTGSAHCNLIPFWSQRLGKDSLLARQISARGGELHCVNLGERVSMAGKAQCFMQGEIELP